MSGAVGGYEVRPEPALPPRGTSLVVESPDEPPRELGVAEGIDLLLRNPDASSSAQLWSEVTTLALDMIARRRLVPTLTDDDVDAWRIGPFDHDDDARLDTLARRLGTDVNLVRSWMDAVADTLPRTAAATAVVGQDAFAARGEPQQYPELRSWVDRTSSALRSGIQVSLRVEPPCADDSIDVVVQVHSLRDPSVVEDAATTWSHASAFHPSVQLATTTILHRAAREWSALLGLLSGAVPDRVAIDADELVELVTAARSRLAEVDVPVHLPVDLAMLTTSVATRDTARERRDLGSVLSGDVEVEFDWQLALGDDALTPAEMDALAETHRPVVRLRDRWVVVTPDIADRVRDGRIGPVTPINALGAALTGTIHVSGHEVPVISPSWLDEIRDRIIDPSRSAVVDVPPELKATLRDYQRAGLRWLAQLTSLGIGGCLADDMGLGKTVTLIALHLHRAREALEGRLRAGPTLVVCPASLLGTWERETTRFAPDVPVTRHHGDGRRLADSPEGFVLTTYGTMRRDASTFAARRWDMVVADEAQHVKNPSSQAARALRTIPAAARVALTGTPIENDLSELWAILDWTTPGLLGSLGQFRSRWATPIEADGDTDAAAGLAKLTAPFILRRRKSDPQIVPELPAKTETDQPVRLTREQVGLYEAVARETMERIATADGMERRGLIMAMLTSLKQVCNHPAHYLREEDPVLPARSGKLDLLDEIVETVVAEDGAVLVFTQYVAMARLLQRHLTDRGVDTVFLHGGTPVDARQAMVDRFQSGAAPVFVASLRAAGTGLTLTRADHVIHYDRWWNPAVEDQATDRAYRIGQTRPVQVHRLSTIGTIEERIADLLAAKRGLADAILTSGETALTDLSDEDLSDLVRLRGDGR